MSEKKNDDILASLMSSELGSFMDGKPNSESSSEESAEKPKDEVTPTEETSTETKPETSTEEKSKGSADAGSAESLSSNESDRLESDGPNAGDGDTGKPLELDGGTEREPETDESVVSTVAPTETDSSGESGAAGPVERSAPDVPASSSVETASKSTSDALQEPAKDETESKPIPISESDEEGESEQPSTGQGATWLLSGLQLVRNYPSSTGWKRCKPDIVEHEEYGEVQLLHGRMGFCAGAARSACGNIAVAFDEDGKPFYLTRTNCVFGAGIPIVRSTELDEWFDSLDLDF